MFILTLKKKSPQTPHLPSKEQQADPRPRAPSRQALALGTSGYLYLPEQQKFGRARRSRFEGCMKKFTDTRAFTPLS